MIFHSDMTKEQMKSEVKFPIYGDKFYSFLQMGHDPITHPSEDAWILCIAETKGGNMMGIYKWQKENNPKNIFGYTYINIHANHGSVRYVEYPHLQDERVILICDEKQKDLIIGSL